MEQAIKPPNRFSHAGCTLCCFRDKDGDGFITKEELGQDYDPFCEQGQNGNQSIIYIYVIRFLQDLLVVLLYCISEKML